MITVPFELAQTRNPQIGLIVLQSDETIEWDMKRLLPDHAELLVTRVPSGTHVTTDTLSAMENNLGRAAALFPQSAQFSAVGYGCTSGTAQIGASKVAAAIRSSITTPHVTDPLTALIAACRHQNITRLGILSPYIQSVSQSLCDTLAQAGIRITGFASFNESQEARVVRIAPASVVSAATTLIDAKKSADQPEALFISCTNLRTLDVIAPIERKLNLTVLTSNQVLAWDLMRRAKIEPPRSNQGALWDMPKFDV